MKVWKTLAAPLSPKDSDNLKKMEALLDEAKSVKKALPSYDDLLVKLIKLDVDKKLSLAPTKVIAIQNGLEKFKTLDDPVKQAKIRAKLLNHYTATTPPSLQLSELEEILKDVTK
jgi:hypothetical protein